MNIFAISDLHLSNAVEKPMDIFGDGWQNHFEKITSDWISKVSEEDIVLLGGDMSWGLTLEEAVPDYNAVAKLSGKKVVVKGNHDYYWNSLGKMRTQFPDFDFIQNNSYRYTSAESGNSVVVCGTRGWNIPDESSADSDIKIYNRELQRLELSLTSAKARQQDGDILIALLHYPPFGASYADSEVTAMLEKYGVNKVLYGHLHGKNVRVTPRINKNGIEYILTSCDLIDNKLALVCQL